MHTQIEGTNPPGPMQPRARQPDTAHARPNQPSILCHGVQSTGTMHHMHTHTMHCEMFPKPHSCPLQTHTHDSIQVLTATQLGDNPSSVSPHRAIDITHCHHALTSIGSPPDRCFHLFVATRHRSFTPDCCLHLLTQISQAHQSLPH
jgi:hypothetical protein